MAPAPPPGPLPLYPDPCFMGESHRVLLRHPHPTGSLTKCSSVTQTAERIPAGLHSQLQSALRPLCLDQGTREITKNHRSNPTIPGSSSSKEEAPQAEA